MIFDFLRKAAVRAASKILQNGFFLRVRHHIGYLEAEFEGLNWSDESSTFVARGVPKKNFEIFHKKMRKND